MSHVGRKCFCHLPLHPRSHHQRLAVARPTETSSKGTSSISRILIGDMEPAGIRGLSPRQ